MHVHYGEAEKAGKETFPHRSANEAFLIKFVDHQLTQPEQYDFGDKISHCKTGFIGIHAQHFDRRHAGREDGS